MAAENVIASPGACWRYIRIFSGFVLAKFGSDSGARLVAFSVFFVAEPTKIRISSNQGKFCLPCAHARRGKA
jgi:hypothetical protein